MLQSPRAFSFVAHFIPAQRSSLRNRVTNAWHDKREISFNYFRMQLLMLFQTEKMDKKLCFDLTWFPAQDTGSTKNGKNGGAQLSCIHCELEVTFQQAPGNHAIALFHHSTTTLLAHESAHDKNCRMLCTLNIWCMRIIVHRLLWWALMLSTADFQRPKLCSSIAQHSVNRL